MRSAIVHGCYYIVALNVLRVERFWQGFKSIRKTAYKRPKQEAQAVAEQSAHVQ
jgi:hypothetical protein